MKTFKSSIIAVKGFFLLFLLILVSSVSAEKNQIFTVSSLNHTGDSLVTLTINIGANGTASISKLVTAAGPNDKTLVSVVGNDMWYTVGGGPDSSTIEIDDQIPNQHIYWVDIELDDEPTVPEGGTTITFFCISYNCQTEEKCTPTTMSTSNKANVECTKPCQRCELRHFVSSGTISSLGGVYVCASSVVYQ